MVFRLSRTQRLFVLLILVTISYAATAVKPQQPAKPVELLEHAAQVVEPSAFSQQLSASAEDVLTVSKVSGVSTESAAFEEVEVARVVDGDTIKLADGRTVRYIGIDTPETVHPTKGLECFGEEAKLENRRLIEGKTVRLVKDVSDTDRYGRLLRYVYSGDDMINEVLVREGFAQTATYPPDVAHQEQFIEAQNEAREAGRGLWSACANEQINQ